MIAIVCFELIPEAMEISSIANVILGIVAGVIIMIFCDNLVNYRYKRKVLKTDSINSLLKTGIVIAIGLALHNFPEGLAIGSGFEASIKLRFITCYSNMLTRYTRRNIDVSSNENRRNENK